MATGVAVLQDTLVITVKQISMSALPILASTTFPLGISLTVEARKGLLSAVFAAPHEQRGETRGLLGAWDGNRDYELVFRNGTVLDTDAPDREIHKFGQDWQITFGESLFCYKSYENVSTFSHPDHMPVFLDEIKNFTEDQIKVCGNGTCHDGGNSYWCEDDCYVDHLYPYGSYYGNTSLRRYLDGVSTPISIEIGFPFFERVFSTAYVGTNGIISFGKPFYFWWPHFFPGYFWIRRRSVVAPFWADVDIRKDGMVWYKAYTDENDTVLKMASRDVQMSVNGFETFEARWVLVATWDRVPNYPDGSYYWYYHYQDQYTGLRNTFQAVLATDGLNSFAIFNYNCGDLQWSGRWSKAVIGYNAEGGFHYENHRLSGYDEITQVDHEVSASNVGKQGKLVYRLSLDPSFIEKAKRDCIVWFEEDQKKDDLSWVEDLEPCPCRWWQAWWDRRFTFDWLSFCAYSTFASDFGSRQQCCYSSDWFSWGALLLGPPHGGSPKRYAPSVNFELHYRYDEKPRKDCCDVGNLCHLYYQRRPSRDCTDYVPQRRAWFWGDPHITTLDGKQYTFNGWGEYIVIKTINDTFVLEGRTQPVNGSSATVFSAFSMAEYAPSSNFESQTPKSDVVHVELLGYANSSLLVMYRPKNQSSWHDISSNFTALDNITSMDLYKVSISRPKAKAITATFPLGISVTVEAKKGLLSVVFAAPDKQRGETRGLLGAWDGNKNYELVFRNGTVLDTNATDREIHKFGQDWQIRHKESLFYYKTYENASTFSHPDHMPVFLDEIKNFTEDQIKVCGDDMACLYDYVQTGDPDIAADTKETDEENRDLSENLANNPPVLSGNSTFHVHINKTSSYSFYVSDPNDTYSVSLMGILPPSSEFSFTNADNTYNFSWTPTGFSSVQLNFIANDSVGGMTVLQPEIRLCGCALHLNATCVDASEDGGENRFIIQDCHCGLGWEGPYCDKDIDGCEEINCFEGVECIDNPPPSIGAKCGPCPNGTVYSDNKCVDINECNSTNGGCQQTCINQLYSFRCDCNSGYKLNGDGKSCSDVNECEDFYPCHQLCNNTAGSFFCSCVSGFKLSEDNRTCEGALVASVHLLVIIKYQRCVGQS
jgi:fibulin 1/2